MWLLLGLLSFVNPESAVFKGETLFISDVGEFNRRGDGLVYRIIKGQKGIYAKGLDDPKGLIYWKGDLYAADINKVWKIKGGKREVFLSSADFPVEPNFLNDIAVDSAGNLYISDTFKGIIFRITPQKRVSLFLRVDSPNGLFFDRFQRLYIATFSSPGRILVYDGEKIDTLLVSPDIDMADGVTIDSLRDLLYVSGYKSGEILRINLNTRRPEVIARGYNTPADITLSPDGLFLWIPELEPGRVTKLRVIEEEKAD